MWAAGQLHNVNHPSIYSHPDLFDLFPENNTNKKSVNSCRQVSNSNEQRFRKFQPEDGWNGSILLLPGPISNTEKIHSKLVEKTLRCWVDARDIFPFMIRVRPTVAKIGTIVLFFY